MYKYITYGILILGVCVQAKLADHFPVVGNERHVVKDALSGRDIIFLTSGEYMNSTQYPHNKAFLEDDKYVIFESSRPRPDGTHKPGQMLHYQDGERQLLAANIETGDIHQLAVLEYEDTAQYGQYHLAMSSQYHSDYAPQTNTVVYYDMTGHNLYILSLNTGQRKKIWTMPYGRIGDPPSITDCGSRLLVYASHPGPAANPYLAGRTTVVYSMDIDTETNDVVGSPKVVVTWAHRTYPESDRGIYLAHPVINPVNRDEMSFSHGYVTAADGSIDKARIWYAKVDGSEIRMACPTPAGRIHTHEVWGPKGKLIYFVDIENPDRYGKSGLSAVDPRTGKVVKLLEGTLPRALHLSVSGDEKRIVFDTQDYLPDNPLNEFESHFENVTLFDVRTKKTTILARQLDSRGHPRQMHPIINRAGNMVVFTVSDGPNGKVAVVKID